MNHQTQSTNNALQNATKLFGELVRDIAASVASKALKEHCSQELTQSLQVLSNKESELSKMIESIIQEIKRLNSELSTEVISQMLQL